MGGCGGPEVDHCGVTPSQLERDAEAYPALYPFGINLVDFLDPDEEREAPIDRRLRSVWRYIVGRVKRFAATLKPREAAILDAEDIIHTITAQLIEKDGQWDPSRGKYSTFVETIIRNVLSTCHEQARAVSGPANSYGRLLGYQERQELGTLTRGMRHTMMAISQVMEDFASFDEDERDLEPGDFDVKTLRRALAALDGPVQVWALVRKYGLFDTQQMTFKQIAVKLDLKEGQVRSMIKEAKMVLRQSLREM